METFCKTIPRSSRIGCPKHDCGGFAEKPDSPFTIPAIHGIIASSRTQGTLSRPEGKIMYEIHDSYGAPQCGCDIIVCDGWGAVEEYFEDGEAMERLEMGYAVIVER